VGSCAMALHGEEARSRPRQHERWSMRASRGAGSSLPGSAGAVEHGPTSGGPRRLAVGRSPDRHGARSGRGPSRRSKAPLTEGGCGRRPAPVCSISARGTRATLPLLRPVLQEGRGDIIAVAHPRACSNGLNSLRLPRSSKMRPGQDAGRAPEPDRAGQPHWRQRLA